MKLNKCVLELPWTFERVWAIKGKKNDIKKFRPSHYDALMKASPKPAKLKILLPKGLIRGIFDIGTPILDTLIWAGPNLILTKTKTPNKCNFSFLIISETKYEHNEKK